MVYNRFLLVFLFGALYCSFLNDNFLVAQTTIAANVSTDNSNNVAALGVANLSTSATPISNQNLTTSSGQPTIQPLTSISNVSSTTSVPQKCSDFESKLCINGECVINPATKQSTCKCYKTHTGALCERPVCLDYCLNDGVCSDGLNANQTNEVTLSCNCSNANNRYTGDRCQFDKCDDQVQKRQPNCYVNDTCVAVCDKECNKQYCSNQGACQEQNHQLTCKCDVGYSGPRCAIDDCLGYCFNNGMCMKSNETIYCKCYPSNYGTRCEKTTQVVQPKGSFRTIIYAFTITMLVCLVAIGVYYAIQKDYFKEMSCFRFLRNHSTDVTRNMPFMNANFSFNKLDDEQIITQNENP